MEQPENWKKIEQWLDLLDGGLVANRGWELVVVGCVVLGSMVFAMVVEQVGPGESLPVLAQLLIGTLIALRGVASTLQERHETLARSLRLLCMVGWVAVFLMLITSVYSSLGLLGALVGLGLLAGGVVLSIRGNRKRLRKAQPS